LQALLNLGLQEIQFAIAQVGRDVVIGVKAVAGAHQPLANPDRKRHAASRPGKPGRIQSQFH
jgi:hypothetical protein